MNVFFVLIGTAILVLVAADIVKTTLSSNGGGTLTNAAAATVWRLFFMAARRKAQSNLLNYAGMGVLVTVLLVWLTGLWLGLFLLLLSDGDSIVSSSDGTAASVLEKLYYAGFSLSTLGVGDYKATTDLWRIGTAVSAFSGLVLLTTSVTYFVPVLSAVNLQNRIGSLINSMGGTPEEILKNSWNGKDFTAFTEFNTTLADMLIQHTLHHHSYPILHYFHNTNPSLSFKLKIVQLSEAYSLIRYRLPKDVIEDRLKLHVLGETLETYFNTVKDNYVQTPHDGPVPAPDLKDLQSQGIPLIEEDQISKIFLERINQQRSISTALLKSDGWTWGDVYPNGRKESLRCNGDREGR